MAVVLDHDWAFGPVIEATTRLLVLATALRARLMWRSNRPLNSSSSSNNEAPAPHYGPRRTLSHRAAAGSDGFPEFTALRAVLGDASTAATVLGVVALTGTSVGASSTSWSTSAASERVQLFDSLSRPGLLPFSQRVQVTRSKSAKSLKRA